jgi:predicted SAM-dependent methyltransferase
MKKVYSNVFAEIPSKEVHAIKYFKVRFVVFFIKSFIYALWVSIINGLGIKFHFFISFNSLKAFANRKISLGTLYHLAISPLDSFRYFEFHYGYEFLEKINIVGYLDISSPRFFPAYLIKKRKLNSVIMLNPDTKDIKNTEEIYKFLGIHNRCKFYNNVIENCDFEKNSFDLITSISVLEHIPMETVNQTIKTIKLLLKSDGYFLVSVPVAKEAYDEFINFNEYNLQEESKDGYYFGQRFHDEILINELFVDNFGEPVYSKIYGEKESGFFNQNRFNKINNINYPSFKESYFFHNNYKEYSSIDTLTGAGVAIYLFKNSNN